jgi:hypothetical protein
MWEFGGPDPGTWERATVPVGGALHDACDSARPRRGRGGGTPSSAVVPNTLPLVSTAYPMPSGEAPSAAIVDPVPAGLPATPQFTSNPSRVNGSTSPDPLEASAFSLPRGPATATASHVKVISLGIE